MGETEFLAVAEAYKAIFWPTPGFKDGTFDSSGFSTEGTLISALCSTLLWKMCSMHWRFS